eukprot:gene14705-16232_t
MDALEQDSDIDWEFCIICQKDANEKLQCPAESSHRRAGAEIGHGYNSLANNILDFQNLGVETPFSKLSVTNEETLASILMGKKAKWHKTCRLKYNTTKLDRLRKRVYDDENANEEETVRKSSRLNTKPAAGERFSTKCFFCDDDTVSQPLHSVTTFDVDRRVRRIATEHEDTLILAKLSAGDMIATEAVYHGACLSKYYNKDRASSKITERNVESTLRGIALAEVIAYMQELRAESKNCTFKLAELTKVYQNVLE